MNMTVLLFQVGFDRFSAMAVDIDSPDRIWENKFDSFEDMVHSLEAARAVTDDDVEELEIGAWFEKGAPILHVVVDCEAIESAGFVRYWKS